MSAHKDIKVATHNLSRRLALGKADREESARMIMLPVMRVDGRRLICVVCAEDSSMLRLKAKRRDRGGGLKLGFAIDLTLYCIYL